MVLTYTYLMSTDLVGNWSCTALNILGDEDNKELQLKYYREYRIDWVSIYMCTLKSVLNRTITCMIQENTPT